VTANKIVELAVEQNARVVVEDLSPLSAIRRRTRIKGSRRGGFNRLLNRVQYEKLKSVLLYKLGEYGLPKPVEVRAAYTSINCPECGHVSKDHRLCVECGQARVPPCRWRGASRAKPSIMLEQAKTVGGPWWLEEKQTRPHHVANGTFRHG